MRAVGLVVVVGLVLVVGLLVAGPVPAAGASPAPEPSSGPQPSPVVLGPGTPIAEGGRVVFPDGGYALTFPGDWLALISGTRENEAILEALRTAAPDLVPMVESLLASGDARILLGVAPGGGPFVENCNVITQAAGGYDAEAAAGATVAALEGVSTIVGGPESQMVTLPAGPAGRIEIRQAVTALDGTSVEVGQVLWILSQEDVIYALTCTGTEPDPGTWAQIASSLEILGPTP
jgi:hypothetical protein